MTGLNLFQPQGSLAYSWMLAQWLLLQTGWKRNYKWAMMLSEGAEHTWRVKQWMKMCPHTVLFLHAFSALHRSSSCSHDCAFKAPRAQWWKVTKKISLSSEFPHFFPLHLSVISFVWLLIFTWKVTASSYCTHCINQTSMRLTAYPLQGWGDNRSRVATPRTVYHWAKIKAING